VDLARWAATEDARLLWLLHSIVSMKSLRLRVVFLVLGFTAIGPLALAYAEILPLPVGGRFILLPAATTVLAIGLRNTAWGRRALVGYVSGFVATGIYDILRLSLTKAGLFPGDPIPGIGRLLLNDPDASWIWGYAWRFLGNGAGMGMAFAMLPWRGWKFGIVYGAAICSGLFVVLAVFPPAQEHFFPLELGVGIGAMAGHWVYGGVLGWLCTRYLPPVRWARGAAGAPTANNAIPAPAPTRVSEPDAPNPAGQSAGRPYQPAPGRRPAPQTEPGHPPSRPGQPARGPAAPGPHAGTGQYPATNGNGRASTGPRAGTGTGQYPATNGNGRAPAGPGSGQFLAVPGGSSNGNGNSNGSSNGNGHRPDGTFSTEFPAVGPGTVPHSAISGPIPALPRNGRPPTGPRTGQYPTTNGNGRAQAGPHAGTGQYPTTNGNGRAQAGPHTGTGQYPTTNGNGRAPGGPRSGQMPVIPGGRDFPALPPGIVPPSAISGPIPVVPTNGRAPVRPGQPPATTGPTPGSRTGERRQQTPRVVPSRAQRHPPKEPEPW